MTNGQRHVISIATLVVARGSVSRTFHGRMFTSPRRRIQISRLINSITQTCFIFLIFHISSCSMHFETNLPAKYINNSIFDLSGN